MYEFVPKKEICKVIWNVKVSAADRRKWTIDPRKIRKVVLKALAGKKKKKKSKAKKKQKKKTKSKKAKK